MYMLLLLQTDLYSSLSKEYCEYLCVHMCMPPIHYGEKFSLFLKKGVYMEKVVPSMLDVHHALH
jgi:hypothetical protein